MLSSLRKNGLTSLFKEVRVFGASRRRAAASQCLARIGRTRTPAAVCGASKTAIGHSTGRLSVPCAQPYAQISGNTISASPKVSHKRVFRLIG